MWVVVIILVFAIGLAAEPSNGDIWTWELGNAVGFVGLAWLYILLAHGRSKLGQTVQHRWLGIAASAAISVHVLWFLIVDPVTIEYLTPGAPIYMVAGLLSFALVVFVSITSLASQRKHSYAKYGVFRRWHRWLSVLLLVLAIAHVVLSGFYIQYGWQWGALAALAVSCYFFPALYNWGSNFQRRSLSILSAVLLLSFVILRTQTS